MEDIVLNKSGKLLTGILRKLIYLLTSITPKFNWVIIQTYPIWEDNGVALYEHLKKEKISKIIWLIPDKLAFVPFNTDSNTIFLKRNSAKAIFYYIFSKYVFITHGLYFRKYPSNQISVNLWHGMPLKKIGIESGKPALITTYTLSTSAYFKPILSGSFGVPLDSVVNIGLPRNVKLFADRNKTLEKLGLKNSSKVIFWLPTYRQSIEGDIRTDGVDHKNIFNIPGFDVALFCRFLEEVNCFCIIKPHPMSPFKGVEEFERLKIIDDAWLYRKNLTLYESLSVCDLLITDISSVLVDYLLLNRPILFSFLDKNEYIDSRGLATDSVFETLPGPLCQSQNEIQDQIKNFSQGNDDFYISREKLRTLYHGDVAYMDCLTKLTELLHFESKR